MALKVTCALINQNGKVLCAQRSKSMSLPLKWELPGGKVELGEEPKATIVRELYEELGIEIEILKALTPNAHTYTNQAIELIPFICKIIDGEPRANEHEKIEWISLSKLLELDWAEADIPIIKRYITEKEMDV